MRIKIFQFSQRITQITKHQKTGKSFAIPLLIYLLVFTTSYAEEETKTKYLELENGLKVFLYERHTLPLVNLVFGVNIGSKDESEETNGLVHILEHYILFKGTELRSGNEIAQDMRRHGAYFNAHTGLDLATFEISLPSEYADFALKTQKEILFNLKITQEELDKEKKVILEELNQAYDDPIKYATSLVYQNLFKNHPYQKPVYGKKEIIEAATVDQLQKFYQKYFIASNSALAIVGDFNLEEMEDKVKNTYGDLKSYEFTAPECEKYTSLKKGVDIKHEMDVNRGYLVIGMIGPDYNSPDQYAVDILTEILGRGINPMLNIPLRQRNLIQTLSMSYAPSKFGGAILIYLTLNPKNMNFTKREALKFLREARHKNYSKKDVFGADLYMLDYLESAKSQIKFKIQQSQERGLPLAMSFVRFMFLNEVPKRGKFLDHIEKTTSSDIRDAADQYLSTGRYVIISIYPKKKK